jgi:hypothetical protein
MNEQAGPACVLSVLIIGVFAVLLYDKDRGTSSPKPSPPSIRREVSRPRGPESAAQTPTPTPRLETKVVAAAPAKPILTPQAPPATPSRPSEERKSTDPESRVVDLGNSSRPRPRVPTPPKRATQPRGAFTVVEPGETLADVAERVYGSNRSAESHWKANRDQLATLESPLPKGALLRTP